MIINKSNIKKWSIIGQRATFGLAALDIANINKNLIVVTSDVSTSAGLDRFRKQFEKQYIDVGIAEQNLIGVAAGLSSEGYDVITTTFSPFQILRCCEQIKVNLSYMNNKVVMVGLASGVALGTLGYTHCSIEDISIARSIPNLEVVCPSDSLETIKALNAAVKHYKSTYIRLTGTSNCPIVYDDDYKFKIGKAVNVLTNKYSEVTIITNGSMVSHSIKAAQNLKTQGINVDVINMHTVTNLDKKILDKVSKKNNLIFTVEEHSIVGGLFSAISEYYLKQNHNVNIFPIAHPHTYGKGGEYNYLLNKYGLNDKGIRLKIIKKIKERK